MNKLILILFGLAIVSAGNVVKKFDPPPIDDEVFIPQLSGPMKISELFVLDCNPKKSKVLLNFYTKENGENKFIRIHLNEENALVGLDGSNFDFRKPTKVFIHGWKQTGTPPPNKNDIIYDMSYGALQYIVKAYVNDEEDVNLFMVDWGEYSNCAYAIATATTIQKVGLYVGEMLTNLIKNFHVAPSDIHLIGHSLGAHIAHYAVEALGNGIKIGRITGLDPAGPNFESIFGDIFAVPGLHKSDAMFVDIIHTNVDGCGISKNIGHVDFYPNGGKIQNGCFSLVPISVCSHERSVAFFADSIRTKVGYYAKQCRNYKDFEHGRCDHENTALMGERASNKTSSGTYYLKTHNAYPFTLGPMLS